MSEKDKLTIPFGQSPASCVLLNTKTSFHRTPCLSVQCQREFESPTTSKTNTLKSIPFIYSVKRPCETFALRTHCTVAQALKHFCDFVDARVTELQYATTVYHGFSATARPAAHRLTNSANEVTWQSESELLASCSTKNIRYQTKKVSKSSSLGTIPMKTSKDRSSIQHT